MSTNIKCNHHKKMDSILPAWLYFTLFPLTEKLTKVEEEERLKLGINIQKKLREQFKLYGIKKNFIINPNNNDALPFCDKCIKSN